MAPGTVGGRLCHPPVVEKKIYKKINKKEKRLALFSAIAATSSKEIVASRGHIVEDISSFPLIVDDKIQQIKKSRDLQEIFLNLGGNNLRCTPL